MSKKIQVSAMHTRTGVNCGDHAQDVIAAVEIAPDETVQDLVTRIIGLVDGNFSSYTREFEDYITLRVVKPVPEPVVENTIPEREEKPW